MKETFLWLWDGKLQMDGKLGHRKLALRCIREKNCTTSYPTILVHLASPMKKHL